MLNSETGIARRYHQGTKHSQQSLRSSQHFLDWRNEPLQYKIYPQAELLPLPVQLPVTSVPTLSALQGQKEGKERIPNLLELAYLLYYTAGITKKLVHYGGEIYFRAASSAGALYPIEVYLVCADLPGLSAGVYHFNPARFGLHRLREGDYRTYLSAAGGWDRQLLQAPAVLVFSGITWRTAWKYQARSYRYHYWDCGTMLANALAASRALDLPAKILMGFVDRQVDRLTGIDGEEEKCLCLMPVGSQAQAIPVEEVDFERLPQLDLAVNELSASQVSYPLIAEMHTASNLNRTDQVSQWRAKHNSWQEPRPSGPVFPLEMQLNTSPGVKPLEETVLKRGSSRRFLQQPIPNAELSILLQQAAGAFPACWLEGDGDLLNKLYLSVHAVEGLQPGRYVYHRKQQTLELLQPGDFRAQAAQLCLGQALGGEASVTLFFLCDLESVLARYGNRGYRLAQMEAGIIGGNLYLGAYALDRGATGLTFFDDEVVESFSPHATGKETIFAVALGNPGPAETYRGQMVKIPPGGQVNLRE